MATSAKTFAVIIERKGRERKQTGTLEELTKYFSYTLEKGASYQHEKGNRKIHRQPKTFIALLNNLNAAENNAAANGCGSTYYLAGEV